MSTQPEALRLAEILDSFHEADEAQPMANELRRLHAENERLANELKDALTPNYFWASEEPELGSKTMHDAIIYLLDCHSYSVGDEIKLQPARFLPEMTVRITAMEDEDGNGELEYEVISAAQQAQAFVGAVMEAQP